MSLGVIHLVNIDLIKSRPEGEGGRRDLSPSHWAGELVHLNEKNFCK